MNLQSIEAREETPGCIEVTHAPSIVRFSDEVIEQSPIIERKGDLITVRAINGTFTYRVDVETRLGPLAWFQHFKLEDS